MSLVLVLHTFCKTYWDDTGRSAKKNLRVPVSRHELSLRHQVRGCRRNRRLEENTCFKNQKLLNLHLPLSPRSHRPIPVPVIG